MNLASLKFLKTERMQVVYILVCILLALICAFRFVWQPLHEKAEEYAQVREALEGSRYAEISTASIQKLAKAEDETLGSLSNEWVRIAKRLDTFPGQVAAQDTELDRIDYKVELYEIRQRLQQKSDELKIQLVPKELGLDENLDSNDDRRVRMLQLKAVEKLADLTLDRQINRLNAIYPLPPIVHVEKPKQPALKKGAPPPKPESLPRGKKIFEEYPVRIECDVDFDHLFTFFQSVFEENQVFIFRNIRVESGPTFDSKLRVKAVLSALLFE